MKAARKKLIPEETVHCGLLSKKEAAQKIGQRVAHVHSSILGARDPLACRTTEALKLGTVPQFPWEQEAQAETVEITSSAVRFQLATKLISHPLISTRRRARESLEMVFEELVSNALYHAYRLPSGAEKYSRKQPVELSQAEKLTVRYKISKEGIYLSVTDQGGSLRLEDISAAFSRTYGATAPEIQGKEGGAGLGLFMVFEAATHYKAVCAPNKHCTVSIWISDSRVEDVDNFSFNYFRVKE